MNQAVTDKPSSTSRALAPSKTPPVDAGPSAVKGLQRITLHNQDSKQTKTIRTTCPYCGVGCGVLAHVDELGIVSVTGDPTHPANFGKLCSKGNALAQTLGHPRRLTHPYYQNKLASMQHQPVALQASERDDVDLPIMKPTNWNVVLEDIANRFKAIISKHGRDSIMFYVSGQLLTEDYYVANKFIKGFIGNNNIDSNSRLCMSSAVAGHKRAFGADLVPGNYEDLEACNLLVLVGSNMAWCHPILFGRFLAAKKANPNKKLVVIDPRRTDSCEFADLHLPIAAGSDTHLYNGLLHYLEQQGCGDEAYVEQSGGVDEALYSAKHWSINRVSDACQVTAESILQFYQLVAANNKTVTAFSMGVNQSKDGTDKVNAIINSHLFTGRVGKVGASPFSLTGQPNAMGGREVGALANLLAAHLDLENADHRQLVADFWKAPQPINPRVGIKACDAADAIMDGRIKAIWIMATNPVVSLPEADKFRQALAECDLVIVSDCSKDSDTLKCADIVLPAQGWGEKSGTVTNSERRISRQRSLVSAAGMAKPDWWILSQVAKRMGLAGFDYQHESEIFNEHVALTAYNNKPSQHRSNNPQPRYLNLAKELLALGIAAEDSHHYQGEIFSSSALSIDSYEAMTPFQWGGPRIAMNESPATKNLQSSHLSISDTRNPKTTLIAITCSNTPSLPHLHQGKRQVTSKPTIKPYPHSSDAHQASLADLPSIDLRLITGRLRDQWHTMTRTGLVAQLNQHQAVPTLTLHPNDAELLNLKNADFVRLCARYQDSRAANKTSAQSQHNSKVLAQVAISDSMRIGDAFMPMHWSDAFASYARVGTLIPTVVDPHSGQPELKNSAISIRPVPMQTFGKILVHPEWQDTIMEQLRAMLAAFEAQRVNTIPKVRAWPNCKPLNESLSLPALTWSLNHQANSVLINLASPVASMAQQLVDSEFWQQFIKNLQTLLPVEAPVTKPIQAELTVSKEAASLTDDVKMTTSFSSAFIVSPQQRQLNFVLTQSQDNKTADSEMLEAVEPSERLIMAIYFAPSLAQLPVCHWLDSCFLSTSDIPADLRYKWLLAGRPASGYVDPGPMICSCMSVGKNKIIEAITKQACSTAVAIGKQCAAGTNCGSCVSQINRLIAEYG